MGAIRGVEGSRSVHRAIGTLADMMRRSKDGAQGNRIYLSWNEAGDYGMKLASKILKSGKKFDIVIGIANGGLPPKLIVADELDLDSDNLRVKSYDEKIIGQQGEVELIRDINSDIKGKHVLLVDDLVDSGKTMEFVVRHLMEKGAASVTTAVFFKKPTSTHNPDFYVDTTEKWVVFPWDKRATERADKANGKNSG